MTLATPTLSPAALAAIDAAGLSAIADKVVNQVRLTDDDALQLYASPNLVAIGALANLVRERMHGDVSWFNRNQHINATNVCEATCIFCSFSRLKTGDAAAYTMSYDEAVGRVKALKDAFITEVHIVNGLNPDLPFDYYPGLLTALKKERPDLHIKGFTAVEIHYYAGKYDMTVPEVLEHLRSAGLDSLPGGGAEIFAARARKKLCDDKVGSDAWIDIHRTAHGMGFRTNCTMLFGSIETLAERVDHMRRLRDLQDETGGFQTFIPLKFHNENNRLRNVAETTDLDCWKTLAIGRLYLDNFAHVKAYWPMMGVQVAQLSQAFGVSDIDGTVREERIYHMAGAKTPQGLNRPELISLIERAGRKALERDTLYRIVAETPALTEVSGAPASTRVASVGYLNAWPLTAKIDRDAHEVQEDIPAVIAQSLADGEADVALVPVAAILTEGDWRVVPGMAIGADGPVDSVLLVAETPPEEWTEVLLDGESRTSAVLAQLLLRRGPLSKRVGELTIRRVGPGEAVPAASGTTAAMVIGDLARELPTRMTEIFDLAGLWKEWTGLPFVFAVWAGRPDLDPRVGGMLREAAAAGRAAIYTEYEGANQTYLSERLRYDLDDRAMMGLRRFAALGKEEGFFAHGDVELLRPESDRHEPVAVDEASPPDVLWRMPLTQLAVRASARQAARPRTTITWRLQGDDSLATRRLVDATAVKPGHGEVVATLASIERAGVDFAALKAAGLTTVSLDDDGPLLTDPARASAVQAATAAGLVVEGAIPVGRGERLGDRVTHVRELERLGCVRNVVRAAGWRGPHTEGQGTAADWLRAASWVRCISDLELIVPQETEGLGVMAIGLQCAVDGIEAVLADDTWETRAWKLDRSLRDAGFEPERIGMETPEAGGRRVARRPVKKALRPDLR